jgi:lycopene beta-cyclase
LIALAVRAKQPAARIAIVERDSALGGNHTWCFHADDVPEGADWIAPLVVQRWAGYDVAFPRRQRHLESAYACTTSARLDELVRPAVDALWLGEPATTIEANRVATASRSLSATAVIDARGPEASTYADTGWQVFLGQEVRVPGHGLAHPMLMDATVPQRGGFRFVYVLPLTADVLLIEDTIFADQPTLDRDDCRQAIADYAAQRGWTIAEVLREETGVLPLPLHVPAPSIDTPLVAGYAGRWFHPTTGYSFPIAARLAAVIAALPPAQLDGEPLRDAARAHGDQLAFACRLNRMLYNWFPPEQRYNVLERFYGLSEPLIRRFYSLVLTRGDRARILLGRPPRGMSYKAALGGKPAWRSA